MVRADRNYPDVYFGRPGALVKMPYPRGDMDKGYDAMKYDFVTATGQHIVSTMIGGSRAYTVSWNALHVDNYAKISQYWLGQMGAGPWVFIDPSAPNMLMENQASTTQTFSDNRGFTANLGSVNVNTSAAQIHRFGATRNLQWLFSTAPGATTPTLTIGAPYRSWYGIPVVPGLPYMFSGWLKPDGTVDTSITVELKLAWLDAAGATIGSLITSGASAVTAWQQLSVGGVAPVGVAYVRPTVVITGSTVLAGGSLFVDELLLEQDTVVNNWAPGTGTRPVEILSLPDTVPFNARFRKGVTLTLRELAQ